MAHDVFISHSTRDKTVADATCAILEQNGIRCWIAPRDVLGWNWADKIVQAIADARVMILIFSHNCNDSRDVFREVTQAFNQGLVVIPLRIEDVRPVGRLDYYLATEHWIDAFTPTLEQHLERLTRTVKAFLAPTEQVSEPVANPSTSLETPPDPPVSRKPRPRPDSRLGLLTGTWRAILARTSEATHSVTRPVEAPDARPAQLAARYSAPPPISRPSVDAPARVPRPAKPPSEPKTASPDTRGVNSGARSADSTVPGPGQPVPPTASQPVARPSEDEGSGGPGTASKSPSTTSRTNAAAPALANQIQPASAKSTATPGPSVPQAPRLQPEQARHTVPSPAVSAAKDDLPGAAVRSTGPRPARAAVPRPEMPAHGSTPVPPAEPRTLPLNSPPGFSEDEVAACILGGRPVPVSWLPLIRRLDLSPREFRFAPWDTPGATANGANAHVRSLKGSRALRSIAPLAEMPSLRELRLDSTGVEDLTPLEKLTALEELSLRHLGVSSLAPLAKLTALRSLDLSYMAVSDLSPLAGLAALRSLHLTGTAATDLSVLAELIGLRQLGLCSLAVSSLAPLLKLTALRSLDLSYTAVSDLSPLAGLTALQSLNLTGTAATDLSPLAELTALQELELARTRVTDLSPLAGLAPLRSLYLYGLPIGIEAVLGRLPMLRIDRQRSPVPPPPPPLRPYPPSSAHTPT